METELIFVYGSLRREIASEMYYELVRHSEYFCVGYMQGKLYEVDEYPGATESERSNDKVFGELYKILNKDKLFALLDEYEGCTDNFPEPREYQRKNLPISLKNSDSVTAWVYVYNHDVSNLSQIESGNYIKYIRAEKL